MKVKIDMKTLQVVSIELDTKDRIDRLELKELEEKTGIGKLIGERLQQGVKVPC
jgi:hypothetical protein